LSAIVTQGLWPSEVIVSDVVGRLIEFWGFKRNHGRIWAVLYLSPEALSAEDLRHSLKLSSGAVSMSLTELLRWGVVRRVWVQGERRDFYVAEVQLWKMISRVFSEREKTEIDAAIEAFEEALVALDRQKQSLPNKKGPDHTRTLERIELQRQRIGQLLDLAKLGKRLLDALLSTAKVDAEPLVRFLLGRSQSHSLVR
jgi:DNA-binding transcriptional regulator GbsR (MarR family)